MKIYTKTGDKGMTSLIGGKIVSKSDQRVEAYGAVDELIAHIGLLRDQEIKEEHVKFLKDVQEQLMAISAILASTKDNLDIKVPVVRYEKIESLEEEIDKIDETLEALHSFILPGGHQTVSFCHIARCICRRAEREVVRLEKTEKIDDVIKKYLNRLSDYLFILSRKLTDELNAKEIYWKV